jgi:AraC family transcriptional regulator, arabinose operon regulatory protein
LDKIAPITTIFKHVGGVSSEGARGLWWHVKNAAHWQCGQGYGCDRKSYDGHQIMFMVRGSGRGAYLGKPWTARGGDAVVMDLRHRHNYWSDNEDPWEMYWVIFNGPGVTQIIDAMILAAGSPVMRFASVERMRADFAAIFHFLSEHPPGYEAWVWHHLTALVANVVEGQRRSADIHDAQQLPGGINAALALLRSDFQRTLALKELAAAAHMSLFHFVRRFKESTGFTPMEYLEKFRIGRAQELLLGRPDLRLKEVAREVGYDDAAYFSRVFHKRTGLSPREYRRSFAALT